MRPANHLDNPRILDLLTRSFDANKSVNFVVKAGNARSCRIRRLMQYALDQCTDFGEVWIADDGNAVALILHPDKKRTTIRTVWRDLELAFSVIGMPRLFSIMKREAILKSFHPKRPFAYLWFIGVAPEQQGKGHGSRLLGELLLHCGSQQRPVCLETSNERNIPFYERHGLELYHSIDLPYAIYQFRK